MVSATSWVIFFTLVVAINITYAQVPYGAGAGVGAALSGLGPLGALLAMDSGLTMPFQGIMPLPGTIPDKPQLFENVPPGGQLGTIPDKPPLLKSIHFSYIVPGDMCLPGDMPFPGSMPLPGGMPLSGGMSFPGGFSGGFGGAGYPFPFPVPVCEPMIVPEPVPCLEPAAASVTGDFPAGFPRPFSAGMPNGFPSGFPGCVPRVPGPIIILEDNDNNSWEKLLSFLLILWSGNRL